MRHEYRVPLALAALTACASPAVRDAGRDAAVDARGPDAPAPDVATPTDASTDAAPIACIPPTATRAPTLGAFDCMALGSMAGAALPSLPFYQPAVDATTIDSVATAPPALPANNRFTVYDGWNGAQPLHPVSSWNLAGYTGLTLPGAAATTQRGQVDAYGQSGVQLAGDAVGLWLNTMDPGVVLYSGSGSINVGCWYQTPPYARLFPTAASELDVAFDVGVGYDGSTGNAHTQAYFQLIVIDQGSTCGTHCGFSFSLGFYARDASLATARSVAGDATGTLSVLLAGAGLDSVGWLHRAADSMHYQTAPFAPQHVHVRMSASEFLAIRDAVAAYAPSQYSGLSHDVRDYGVALLNVNGEDYDPCKDSMHIAPCLGGDHAQLGMSVRALRVASTVPHQAAGRPAAAGARVAYRSSDGSVAVFAPDGPGFASTTVAPAGSAAGDPSAFAQGAAVHVVFRDSALHVRDAFSTGAAWTLSDIGASRAADADPAVFGGPDGNARIVYRDAAGDVHVMTPGTTGWTDDDASRAAGATVPAAGSPQGFALGTTTRIVYADTAHRVHELQQANGAWRDRVISLAAVADAYSDPSGFFDAAGRAHAVFRDVSGGVHDLYEEAAGWNHRAIDAPPSLGSPRAYADGCTTRVVYQGTDGHVHDLAWDGRAWSHTDLATTRGALSTGDDPAGSVGDDGIARVVYRGPDAQLHAIEHGALAWIHRDY